MAYGVSNVHVIDDVTYVTPKGQTCDPNTQYLKNSWICYLATIANY